jgi:lipocalin
VNGVGTALNPSKPNFLSIQFNIQAFGQQLFQTQGSYIVWDTDYTSYSLVYSCSEQDLYFFKLKTEYVWILSRNSTLDADKTNMLRAKLQAAKVDLSSIEITNQQYCK